MLTRSSNTQTSKASNESRYKSQTIVKLFGLFRFSNFFCLVCYFSRENVSIANDAVQRPLVGNCRSNKAFMSKSFMIYLSLAKMLAYSGPQWESITKKWKKYIWTKCDVFIADLMLFSAIASLIGTKNEYDAHSKYLIRCYFLCFCLLFKIESN